MRPWVGLSCMLEPGFLKSALPLFEQEQVEMLEWSFDVIHEKSKAPSWLPGLLNEYSNNSRLVAHGVRYSLLDARWGKRQQQWLKQAKAETKKYNYRYFTEHFGFMTSGNFHKGAPLTVPLNEHTLLLGTDRLMRLQEAVQLPVGLENLAFAFSEDEVKEQGEFLEKLISPVNGFIILDLHNVWCQSLNFKKDVVSLIKSYPLDKVRELHISGGSWEVYKEKNTTTKIRRDTHDEAVPEALFKLLPEALALCPNTECVVFERLGHTLKNEKEIKQFQYDFLRIKKIVAQEKKNEKPPKEIIKQQIAKNKSGLLPYEDKLLYRQQKTLINILEKNKNPQAVIKALKKEKQLCADWGIDTWSPGMIDTAIKLIKKWG